jgi:hypothetical protein
MVVPYFSKATREAVTIFSTGKDSVAGTPRVKFITGLSDMNLPRFFDSMGQLIRAQPGAE